jgi:hypothetical protein
MHLPTLTHLHLNYIKNFPVSVLFSCIGLKHLQLDYVSIKDECTPSPPGLYILTVPRILEYSVSQSATITVRLLTTKLVDGTLALNFTNLQRLSVEFRTNEDVEVTRSLLKESNQLEELRVKGKKCFITFPHFKLILVLTVANHGPATASASLSGLGDLGFHTFGTTLCISLCAVDCKSPRIFCGLCNELSAMSIANNTLKTLRIELKTDVLEISSSGDHEWERLDVILSGPRWSFLENISIDIIALDYRNTPRELLPDSPKRQLTRLSTRTSFNFKFSVRAPSDTGWSCLCPM